MCVKAIQLIEQYPGCNGLIARSTFPKLNDTIRKEFKKWCPPHIIASFPESKNSDNTAKFTMGSQINFRYIAQQGKTAEQSTSNLLSATYDWAIVDQMEDPEITYKDFLDLLGRLRGNTIYRGRDPRMPKTGPRFLMMSVNPTANWFFTKIVRPLKIYEQTGRITDDLLCERDKDTKQPILIDGKPILLVELYEAPTTVNAMNLGEDFISTMQSAYRGQMYDRFVLGKWAAYEGLVYPDYEESKHVVAHSSMLHYLDQLSTAHYKVNWIEAYDFGIASPSCYLLAFVDPQGMVHVVDGFYKAEYKIKDQVKHIKRIRALYGINPDDQLIYGDPSIFRRSPSKTANLVGESTTELFYNESDEIRFQRGNNDIINGILKVGSYLAAQKTALHPYIGDTGSPMLFFSDSLGFITDEITAYMWQKDTSGTSVDKPVDKNDHAMDTLKYLLTDRPDIAELLTSLATVPKWMQWRETESATEARYARYGQ